MRALLVMSPFPSKETAPPLAVNTALLTIVPSAEVMPIPLLEVIVALLVTPVLPLNVTEPF